MRRVHDCCFLPLQRGRQLALFEGLFFVAKLVCYVIWAMSVERTSSAWQGTMGLHAEVYSMLPIDAFGNVADIDQTKHTANIMVVVVIVHTVFEIWHEWDLLNDEVNFRQPQAKLSEHGKGQSRCGFKLARLWRWLVIAYGTVREQV